MGATCSVCKTGPGAPRPGAAHRLSSDRGSTTEQASSSQRIDKAKPPPLRPSSAKLPAIEARNATVSSRPQTHWEAQTISMAIHRHSVLTDLTEGSRDVIISHMQHYQLDANEIVFEQGAEGSHFFVVGSGALEVLVNTTRVNVLKSGDSFGELALLHDVPRSATVRTLEKSDLWGLDRVTFREAVKQINVRNYKENRAFLDSVPIFAYLTSQEKDKLLGALSTQRFFPGKQVVTEGEPGDVFYIIKEGTVTCSANGVEVRKMRKGDYFGEQALLYNTVRTATVVSDDTVKLLSIGRDQLAEVLGQSLQQVLYKNTLRIAFDRSDFMSKLTLQQKESVIEAMTFTSFAQGEIVVGKGVDVSKAIRVVLKGELVGAETVHTLGILGDKNICGSWPVHLTQELIASDKVDLAVIDKSSLERLLGGDLAQLTRRNEIYSVLRSLSIFRGLPHEKILELLSALQTKVFPDKTVIFRQGEAGDSLYIVDSGQVQAVKDGLVLRTITKSGFFGDRSVLTGESRTATAIAIGETRCLVLQRVELQRVVDESVTTLLRQRLELQDDTVTLDQLALVKEIGRGSFGVVYMVVHRTKGTLYAVKSVSRSIIRKFDIYESLRLEREILLQLDHLLIMKLVKTFKDRHRVYFLMELVRGMDLFDGLRSLGLVKEADSRFYAACLLLIMEHLHERNIVYRDLKPENVVIDHTGYLKLVDFGTAKVLEGRTFTLIGTPHYMAPEAILGKGYGLAVDLWSTGAMLFEFLTGVVPFGEGEEDPFAIYEKILRESVRWPGTCQVSEKAKYFTELLLCKNEATRDVPIPKLRQNCWFFGFEWEKLLLKQLTPPLVPSVPSCISEVTNCLKRVQLIGNLPVEIAATENGPAEPEGWDQHF